MGQALVANRLSLFHSFIPLPARRAPSPDRTTMTDVILFLSARDRTPFSSEFIINLLVRYSMGQLSWP
jgi:hypothetical protein